MAANGSPAPEFDSDDDRTFKRTVSELLNDSSIKYTVPDKPNSRLQKYRLTEKGLKLLENQ